MSSNTTDKIDTLAKTVERLIDQNEEVLAEYEEEYTPFSEAINTDPSQVQDVDVDKLFS